MLWGAMGVKDARKYVDEIDSLLAYSIKVGRNFKLRAVVLVKLNSIFLPNSKRQTHLRFEPVGTLQRTLYLKNISVFSTIFFVTNDKQRYRNIVREKRASSIMEDELFQITMLINHFSGFFKIVLIIF